jgi:hypothetical protein
MFRPTLLQSVGLDLISKWLPGRLSGRRRRASRKKARRPGRSCRWVRLELEPLEERALLSASIFGNVWNDLIGNGIRQATDPAVAGQVVYLDLNHDGKLDSITNTIAATSTGITAAGAGPVGAFGGVGSALQVQNLPSTILDLAVTMDLTNNSSDPVQVAILSPLGSTIPQLPIIFTIMPGQHFVGTFDGDSSNPVTLAPTPVPNGTYAPQQSFASPNNFVDNSSANGTWALVFFPPNAADVAGLELTSWSLTFISPEPSTQTDAAGNYSFTGLAPGTYSVALAHSAADKVTSPPSAAQSVTVADGQTVTGVDFGVQPAPDLTSIHFALASPAADWGQPVTVNYTLTNQGAGNAPAFDVGLYLSSTGVISTAGPLLQTLHFSGLAAGASTSGSVTVLLPADPPPGFDSVSTAYAGFVIDPTGAVLDANPGNNSNQGAGIDLALLGAQPNGAVATGQGVQQSPSVAVDPTNPNHLVTAYMDYSLLTTGYAGIGVAVSNDGGKNWTNSSIPLPAGFDQGAAAPTAAFDGQGNVYISFMAATFLGPKPTLTSIALNNASQRADGLQSNNGIFVVESRTGGLTWDQPVAVSSNLYNPATGEVPFDTFPEMAIDTFRTLPTGDPNPNYGNVYVTWLRLYPPGQFPGDPTSKLGTDVMFAVGSAGVSGLQFVTQMQDVPGPGPGTGRVSAIKDPIFGSNDTGVLIRNNAAVTVGPGGAVYVATYTGGFFTVYYSTDGGKSISTPAGLVSGFTAPNYSSGLGFPFGEGFLVLKDPNLAADQFRTLPVRQIAADPTRPGVLYAVAANDGLDLAPNGALNAQGIIFATSTDYGQTWTSNYTVGSEPSPLAQLAPAQVNSYYTVLNDDNGGQFPGFAASPQSQVVSGTAMPSISVSDQGVITVVWYDTRSDPSGRNLQVWGTVSTDGGQHFSANFPVTNTSFDPNAGAFTDATGKTDFYLGDQIGVAAAGNTAYAVWTDTRAGNQDIYVGSYALTPTPAGPTDRFSPNDTPQTATDLGNVSAQRVVPRLTLPPGSSNEWFSLQAAATGVLSVSVTAASGGADLRLQLTDAAGNVIPATVTNVVDASGAVVGQELVAPSVAGQTYKVEVSADSDTAISYTLTAGALTADLGTQVQGTEAGSVAAGGQDDYRLTAGVTGSLLVTLAASQDVQGAGLSLQILSADGQTVLASGPAAGAVAGGSEQVSLHVTQGQVVLLQVTGLDANSLGDFTLQFTNLDQFEVAGAQTLFFPTTGDPTSIAAADLTGNGTTDLLVTNTDTSDTLGVLLGNGDGTFQPERQSDIGPGLGGNGFTAGNRQLAVANLINGDKVPDVIVPNFRAADVSVLLGRGDGSFQPQRIFNAVASPDSLVTGEFTHDGNTDAIVLQNFAEGRSASEFAVLLGRGDGTFLPPVFYQTVFTQGAGPMVSGDFNGDGNLDLIIFSKNEAEAQIFFGNGDGTFRDGGVFATGENTFNAAAVDLTGDGKLDLVTTGTVSGDVYVMLGNGDGTFQAPVAYQAMAPRPGESVGVFGLAVTDFGNSSPNAPLNLVVTAQSRTGAGPAEVIMLPGLGGGQFGAPEVLATVGNAGNIVTGDFTGDGTTDLAVADKGGVTVIYGNPLSLSPNNTAKTARNLGTLVHQVLPTQAIVTDHEDAYFTFTVPTEAAQGAGPEVIDISGDFQFPGNGGLGLEVTDSSGNVLGSGERFRIEAAQGQVLTVHIFGVSNGDGSRGFGAYTLDIDVLPQVASVQALSALPGGPATSIVVTFQGDRLDPATAENPANYVVTWFGPDGQQGTADDQVIPVAAVGGGQPIVYDPSTNVEVGSGLTYPTAVRQTVTLLFASPLPAGNYEIKLGPDIQAAPLSPEEAASLAGDPSFAGHPVVSARDGIIQEGSSLVVPGLVTPAGTPNPDLITTGTPFLTQLQNDLSALLDAQLKLHGDDPQITAEINNEILARFAAAFGGQGAPLSIAILWLDPVSLDVQAPQGGQQASYNLQSNQVSNSLPRTYIEVGGNVEVVVMAGVSGSFKLDVGDVPATARGGAVVFDSTGTQLVSLTTALRDGVTDFVVNVAETVGSSLSTASSTQGQDATTTLASLVARAAGGLESLASEPTLAEATAGSSVVLSSVAQVQAVAGLVQEEEPEAEEEETKKPDGKQDKKVGDKEDAKKENQPGNKTNGKAVEKPDDNAEQNSDDEETGLSKEDKEAVDQVFLLWSESNTVSAGAGPQIATSTERIRERPADKEESAGGTRILMPKDGRDLPTLDLADAIPTRQSPEQRLAYPSGFLPLKERSGSQSDAYLLALLLVAGTCPAGLATEISDESKSRKKLPRLLKG